MTEVLIKSEGGEEGRRDILPLTSVPLCLSPPLRPERRVAEAFYCNEEKCINLARPARRWSVGRVKVHRADPFS